MVNGTENPPIELELTLIRHGYTQWNVERRYLGHTDLPLLPQALIDLSALKAQPELAGGFWRVYCSDLLRCRETLAYLTPSLEKSTIYDKRLREMNFGDWEGCTYEQLKDKELYRSWIDDPDAVTPPGGESWKQFEVRLCSFWSELGQAAAEVPRPLPEVKLPRRVLIVTHGGVIREMLAHTVPGVTFRNAESPSPGTATLLRLLWREGKWGVIGSNYE